MTMNEAPEHARDLVQRLTPSLRRFARALSAGLDKAKLGDGLVRTALERSHERGKPEGLAKADLYRRIVLANRGCKLRNGSETETSRRLAGGLSREIERLPLDQREALLLIVLEGFSYDEAAAILGIPRSSVLARLVRARSTLAGGEKAGSAIPYLRVVK